ncbi:MAG: helix-turn-helix domain-containing protein [Clostridia bacterium]|nr:helix-turn-helix domain-containing protein [Clostridia bacterium]
MEVLHGKHADLSIDRPEMLCKIARALSSPVRIQIMQALGKRSMNVGELAELLDVPMSTTALAVKTLEEAGIITSEAQPGARGSMKLCSRKLDTIAVTLVPIDEVHTSILTLQMPIGGYSTADGIEPTCGLANENTYIGDMDNPASFYVPDRFGAQLIWFRQGALEYRFAFPEIDAMEIDWLEISFEACSEAPMYRDPWKSDIAVAINGRRLGIWTSPCDCGGRHGKLTPGWWSDLSTQYGFLKTWHVDHEGSYLENMRISDVCLCDLGLHDRGYISVRIEVPDDVENIGGINLFGEHFGDYEQPLVLRVGYHMRTGEDSTPNNLE